MKIKKQGFDTSTVLFIALAILMLIGSLAHAQMCQVIRIDQTKGGGSTRIEIAPEKITIPVGTCTVWINWVKNKEVQVSFRENAKHCILSSGSASGFQEMELKGGESCYISDTLPLGKSASLLWDKPGLFKYTLEFAGHDHNTTGPVVGIIEVK